jgi:hypothetical protein
VPRGCRYRLAQVRLRGLGPARCPRGRSGTASTPCSPPEFGQRARELQAAYARYDGAGPGGGVDPGGGRVGSSVG